MDGPRAGRPGPLEPPLPGEDVRYQRGLDVLEYFLDPLLRGRSIRDPEDLLRGRGVERRDLLDRGRHRRRVPVEPGEKGAKAGERALEKADLQSDVRWYRVRVVALHLVESPSAVPVVRLGVDAHLPIDQDEAAPGPRKAHHLALPERLKDARDRRDVASPLVHGE